MAYVEDALAQVQERQIHPEGKVDLRITSFSPKTYNSGRTGYLAVMETESNDGVDYEPVFHNIMNPTSEELDNNPAQVNRFQLDKKRFLQAFAVIIDDNGGWDDESLVGCVSSTCSLKVKEYQGRQSSELILPRLNR
jgi:hypothetical protein